MTITLDSRTLIRMLLLSLLTIGMMGAGCDPFAGCVEQPTDQNGDDGTGNGDQDGDDQDPDPNGEQPQGSVASVVFAPVGGPFGDTVDVFLSSLTLQATIRYTTDGTDPTSSTGTIYSGTAVRLTETTTIKAIAYKTGMNDSSVTQATYTKVDPVTIVAQPLFSPDGGNYPTPVDVEITCATAGATIRYTTDGTDPSETNGTVIANGGSVNISGVQNLAAIAYKAGMTNSPLRRATYRTLNLVLIPAGTFQMGDSTDPKESTESPVHAVTLKSFYLGKYEVTQAEWQEVMGSNPAYFTGDLQRPVEQVSYDDCQTFVTTLQNALGLPIRLPTEAEWEYACRAGTLTDFHYGNDAAILGTYAWYDANSEGTTHAVGMLLPNAFGLYDMHGNVWEWCSDWYGEYGGTAATDPTGPATGTERVLRGGAWYIGASSARASARGHTTPDSNWNSFGLRIAMDAE